MNVTPDEQRPAARGAPRAWAAVAVAGIGFQVLHLIEHVAQAGYWALHRAHDPWLTPWAETGRDALALGGDPHTGSELLHLGGNLVFLLGLVALAEFARRSGIGRVGALRLSLLVQGFHVGEHVLLTTTWMAGGQALGFSTLFGALSGTALVAHRVWWHFVINLAATALGVAALLRARRLSGLGGVERTVSRTHVLVRGVD